MITRVLMVPKHYPAPNFIPITAKSPNHNTQLINFEKSQGLLYRTTYKWCRSCCVAWW